jgi:hypothetical protein
VVNNGVVLAGLPATGKTSYLALLFHAIVEDRAEGLRLGRFDDDREHVTEISDVLLASKVADHTTVDDEQDVTLSLAYGDVEFVLNIPDLSGETWEHALVDRRWPSSLDDVVANATGFMVFVHCKDINDGLTIVDAQQAAAAILGDDAPDDEAGDDPVGEQTPGLVTGSTDTTDGDAGDQQHTDDDDDMDADEETHCKQLTQVSLIELIQFFAATSPRPVRVSVIVSAWDLEPKKLKPQQWLSKNAPMLAQFFEVNTDEVEATVWGVSAQGADLFDAKVREEYKDKDPIDRARILAADGTEVGVAAPLRWVLRLDQ